MTETGKKTFIVTGANSGVGRETARGLAGMGHRVVMAVRNEEKGRAALEDVRRSTGSDALALAHVDLADLRGLQKDAEALLAKEERIDVLVNNAGLGTAKKGARTKDGLPLTMGVNHVGTFYLTALLLPRLLETAERAGEARLVNVSSMTHALARAFDPHDLMPRPRPLRREEYSESKLANLLHAREAARRHGDKGLRAHAVHPGFVASNFGRKEHFPGPAQLVFNLTRPFQISPEKGARTSLHAATSEEAGRLNGCYFKAESPSTPWLPDDAEDVQKALWEETERVIEKALQERR